MSLYKSGVRGAFDEYILKKSKERRDYGDYWSASSAGYCMRKNIFDRLGVPEVNPDPRKYRVFEVGHIVHEFMQRITKEAGLSIAQEVELIDDDLMVKGHFDDLIKVDDSLILYDYKSVSSQSFKYKKDKMGDYHTMQLGTYMYMLRKKEDRWLGPAYPAIQTLDESRILNISKDDLRMSEVQLMWSPDLEKRVVGYWKTLNGYWNNKKMPACTCESMDGGFMSKPQYNPYFYDGEPCSLKYYKEWKERQDETRKV